jgi:hypothetical protein
MGVNSSSTSQVCSSIDIEEHRGPCKCKCLIKSCHYNKVFNRDSCQCMCKDTFAVLKRDCLINGGGRATSFWDEETCSCKCRPRRCVKGHYQGIFKYGYLNIIFLGILNYPQFFPFIFEWILFRSNNMWMQTNCIDMLGNGHNWCNTGRKWLV